MSGIWAVIPVKELEGAKQRLSAFLSPEERHALAVTMMEEVLAALLSPHLHPLPYGSLLSSR